MGIIIADDCIYKEGSLPYIPLKVPLWKVRILMKRDNFRDSLLLEELRFNLAHHKYPDRYSKRLRKLLVKYFKEIS